MRFLLLLLLLLVACRRENPAIKREATAVAARTATAVAQPTPTPVVASSSQSQGATSRIAKISAGNLGIGSAGISAGIQVWSKPGGVLAGGATMSGTVADGATVDVLSEEQYLGQKYYQIKSGSTQGWVDGRFIQTP